MLRKLEPRKTVLQCVRAVQGRSNSSRSGFASEANSSSVDREEIQRFSQHSNEWWRVKGEFAALHTMNKLRIPLIKQSFTSLTVDMPTPLSGKAILDVGCGGGILSEPLARLGATVVGLDADEDGIRAAKDRKDGLRDEILNRNLTYHCDTVEKFLEGHEESFDIVVASEVVEHVASLDTFVESCVKLIKPGGTMVITTISQTYLSYWLTIVAAEYLLNMVPRGTHDWNKYINPKQLRDTLQKYGCDQTLLHGMCLNPATLAWSWTGNTDVNYAARFVKAKR